MIQTILRCQTVSLKRKLSLVTNIFFCSLILVAARSTSGSELDQSVDDKSRSSSISNGGKRSRRWSKPKRTSAKSKTSPCRPGKPKWYIPTESDPSINAETASLSSSLSTPTLSSSRKNLGKISLNIHRFLSLLIQFQSVRMISVRLDRLNRLIFRT